MVEAIGKYYEPIPNVGYKGLAIDGPARGLYLTGQEVTLSCNAGLWRAGGFMDLEIAMTVETYHWQSWMAMAGPDGQLPDDPKFYFGFWALKPNCCPAELLDKLCLLAQEARKLLERLNKHGLDKDL